MLHRLATWLMITPSVPLRLRILGGLYATRKPQTPMDEATARDIEARWRAADYDSYAQFLALLERSGEQLAEQPATSAARISSPQPIAAEK